MIERLIRKIGPVSTQPKVLSLEQSRRILGKHFRDLPLELPLTDQQKVKLDENYERVIARLRKEQNG